jgi:hypothetical protein
LALRPVLMPRWGVATVSNGSISAGCISHRAKVCAEIGPGYK